MKKIKVILLLFVLFAPFAITYGVLQYQKSVVRHQVKWDLIEGISRKELVLIKVSANNRDLLKWKHSKEFEYDNQMYDVVETQTNGDTTYYWCWWDNEETILNKKLSSLISSLFDHNPVNQETQNKFASFFKSLYSSTQEVWESSALIISKSFDSYVINKISSRIVVPATPPPIV